MWYGFDGEPHPVLSAYSTEDQVTSACRGHCMMMCFQLDPSDWLRVTEHFRFGFVSPANVTREYTTWALNGSSKLFRA